MVVTIVVLLILAGVSISLVVDKNGIIQKSKDARREYGQAKANEQEDLSNLSDMIDEATAEPTPKVNVNTKAGDNSTINGKKGNSNNPTIPKNYIPIDTATSTWGDGSTAPSQDSVNHGLVIKGDSDDNEWVWIPVPDVTVMCDTANETEYTLCGTSGETAVKTKLYSSTITIGKDSNTKTITRTTPGTTTDPYYREPDLVVGSGTSHDATYYNTILGENGTKEELAQLFVDEYKEMIESIKKCGGFYIGRYELSEAGVQKNQPTLVETNWYNLYNACKDTKLQASEKVETRMIWGCQWDVTCNFIANKGDKKDIADSRTWGNYNDSEGDAKVIVTENGTETKKYGSKQNTGYSEYWKANNIYDLAGNCYEWTQEALSVNGRAVRGGNYGSGGSGAPASLRGSYSYCPDFGSSNRFSSHFNNKVALNSRA